MRVRVRGIYATALSKLLIDHGFIITLPSEKIAKRLMIPKLTDPPDVTIISEERSSPRIFVTGKKEAVERIKEFLDKHLRFSGRVYSEIGRGAIVVGKVVENRRTEYVVDFGKFKSIVRKASLSVGETRLFRIEAPPTNVSSSSLASTVLELAGRYARIFTENASPSVSRFIVDERKRRRLIEIGRLLPRGFRVHRRSSAEYASEAELRAELQSLVESLSKIMRTETDEVGKILSYGEPFVFYILSSEDLSYLDRVRSKVVPTIRGHHSRKSAIANLNKDYSPVVDVLEKALEKGVPEERLVEAMREYALEGEIKIFHVRPYGSSLSLRPGTVYESSDEEIILYRKLSRGKLDGLGVPIEEGDYDLMHVYLGKRHILHEYRSASGEIKGYYMNINTPPEILPGAIRYLDLFVDVVKRPGEEAKIIDREELEAYKARGLLSEALYKKALEEAEKALSELNSRTPRCFPPYKPRTLPPRRIS